MSSPLLTAKKLYLHHREMCPDSLLSERAIRMAIKDGSLPSVPSGNRRLVRLDVFEAWTRGEVVR